MQNEFLRNFQHHALKDIFKDKPVKTTQNASGTAAKGQKSKFAEQLLPRELKG